MKKIRDWHMTSDEKKLAALRILYRGGYTELFTQQAASMLQRGFAIDDLLGCCIDSEMERWVRCIENHTPIIALGSDKR